MHSHEHKYAYVCMLRGTHLPVGVGSFDHSLDAVLRDSDAHVSQRLSELRDLHIYVNMCVFVGQKMCASSRIQVLPQPLSQFKSMKSSSRHVYVCEWTLVDP
jgi:hypothetical protein